MGQPRFAVLCAAVAVGQGIQQLGGDTFEAFRLALGRAREELGPEEYDALWARFAAMSYDDAVAVCHAGTMRTRSLRALAPLIIALVCTAGIAGPVAAATATPSKKDIAAATAVVLKAAKLQYSGHNGPAYDLLVPAQQDLMSRDDFVANCTVEYTTPITIKKFEPTKAHYETVTVPGTSSEQSALALTISVTATNGKKTVTQPVDVLAFHTASGWTWAMTQAQLDGCGGTAPVG